MAVGARTRQWYNAPLDAVTGSELVEAAHVVYARLRRESPVWQLPGVDAYWVTSWDLVTEATGRVDDFSNHFRHTLYRTPDDGIGVLAFDAGTDVFAGADPPAHTEHRRLFFPELVQRRMATIEPDVAAVVDEHLGALLRSGGGDATRLLADPVPLRVVVERVIGLQDPDVERTRRWVFAGARLMGGRLHLEEMGDAVDDAAGMLPWVTEQLGAAVDSGRTGDVLGAAAAGVRDGVLSRDEAAFALMVLVGAGGETTTSLIGNAIRVLAEQPTLQGELRRDVRRVPAFIEEVLRLESPFRFHPRSAARDTELGGVPIPAGALVVLCWASANRDGAVFERPDELVLDRPNVRQHLAFGRGIHHCVGAPLARLEARVVLTKLLLGTGAFVLDPADPPRWVDSLWIHRHDRLPIVVDGRRR
jgi:cytochrome P450 family 144